MSIRKIVIAVSLAIMCSTVSAHAAQICSKSGECINVAPSAQNKLQCVINYVEARGVTIKYMRGYGHGTVRHSLHPSGRALDINQTGRNRTRPHVPVSVSNGAADTCGVVSGARWNWADNGHWNLGEQSHTIYSARRKLRHTTKVVSASPQSALTW